MNLEAVDDLADAVGVSPVEDQPSSSIESFADLESLLSDGLTIVVANLTDLLVGMEFLNWKSHGEETVTVALHPQTCAHHDQSGETWLWWEKKADVD